MFMTIFRVLQVQCLEEGRCFLIPIKSRSELMAALLANCLRECERIQRRAVEMVSLGQKP